MAILRDYITELYITGLYYRTVQNYLTNCMMELWDHTTGLWNHITALQYGIILQNHPYEKDPRDPWAIPTAP